MDSFNPSTTLGIDNPLVLAFPWRIACGTIVTMLIAVCFKTPGGRVLATAAVPA